MACRLALCVTVLMVGTPGARAQTGNLTAIAKAGFETCMKAFPDPRQIHTAMLEDGWRYEQSLGRYKLYSKENRRILAGTPTVAHGGSGCLVAVSKLTGDGAISLAKSVLAAVPSAEPTEPTTPDALSEWAATVNGQDVHFGAMKPGDFVFMRGAGIVMSTE